MALPFIAESGASAIIGNLVDTCLSYLQVYPKAGGMQDQLARLQDTLPHVQLVLTAVEEGAPSTVQDKALESWLWQLRDAVENAEDVLDELEYYQLEKTIQGGDDKVRGILSKFMRKYDSFVNRFFSDDTLNRLREAVEGLDRVVAGIGPFIQLVTGPERKRQKLEEVRKGRETSSLLTESEVVGRDKERDLIVEWLMKPVDGQSQGIAFHVSAYTVVGMGGLGKTTLAQLISQDESVRKHFDLIMWVCVSQDFDAATITRKMLEGASTGCLGHKSLNALQEDLKQKLTSKRFLLILDDVWEDEHTMEWEKLVAPLKFGQRGSKILLTTRMDSVADMAAKVMKCKRQSLNLNELEESDSMSLFNKHAFLGVNPDDYRNLQPIGEQIAKKVGGCPLAIKVMGGLLNSCFDFDYWNRILNEDVMKLLQGKDDIMTILKLSYDHLPIYLRVCFRYCSIFPQDYTFKRKELVHMWMGSCLIPQSIYRRQRPEDIGKDYFNLLTKKSFFTCKTSDNGVKIFKRYVMHDLLHDLAQSVSRGECIRIGDDVAGNPIPHTVRHLFVSSINLHSIRAISNLKNVRTLIISIDWDPKNNADHLLELNKAIEGFKKLRLLSIPVDLNFFKMPNASNSLMHPRYLSLSQWMFTTVCITDFFCSTLCRLYHLQFLKLFVPRTSAKVIEYDGLTNLVNLRSLDAPLVTRINIPYASKLPFIRKLPDFFVREKSGYKITELKNLRDLRHLCIRKLENVKSSEEAMEAKLNEKECLKSLSLVWSRHRSSCVEPDEQLILGNLRPHINLKRLRIEEYRGVNFPRWMSDLSLINLTSVELINCKGLEHLPPLGQLLFLNLLRLSGLHGVKKIDFCFFGSFGGCSFPSLKDLAFEDLPNLEELIGINDGCMFPKLRSMQITSCPNLRGIPTLPCSLRELKISNIGLTAFSMMNEVCGNNDQEYFNALELFTITRCEKLEYIPPQYFSKFKTLRVLEIGECSKLTARGACGNLAMPLLWSANLSSLTQLTLFNCASITSLPPAQACGRWTMLSHLSIWNCKELSSLGGIQALISLHSLEIKGCDKLIEVASQMIAVDCFLKLHSLSIDHHALLLLEPLRSLSSIRDFTLGDASQLTSLPEEWLLQNRSALKKLWIYSACSLQSLPQSLTKLCSLEYLHIGNAKLIKSLPDLPTSLGSLHITGCHPGLKERCQLNIGLDWAKIANIPRVYVTSEVQPWEQCY